MFCKECGNKLNDNIKFCKYCGVAQSTIPSSYSNPLIDEKKEKEYDSYVHVTLVTKKKKTVEKQYIWVLLILTSLLIIGLKYKRSDNLLNEILSPVVKSNYIEIGKNDGKGAVGIWVIIFTDSDRKNLLKDLKVKFELGQNEKYTLKTNESGLILAAFNEMPNSTKIKFSVNNWKYEYWERIEVTTNQIVKDYRQNLLTHPNVEEILSIVSNSGSRSDLKRIMRNYGIRILDYEIVSLRKK